MRRTLASLFVVLVGAALAWPRPAESKGQICNVTPQEARRIDLELRAASIDGRSSLPGASPSPTPTNDAGSSAFLPHHLRTETLASVLVTHARVSDGDGGTRTLHVERQP